MQRLERLVAMSLFLASRRRVLAKDIADRFSVSLRTVYRDARTLSLAGFPLEGTAGDGYRLTQDAFLRPLSFTASEAEALTLVAHVGRTSIDARLRESLALAKTKLESALDTKTRRRVRDLEARVVIPNVALRDLGPIDSAIEAMRDRRVVDAVYEDAKGKATARALEPLGFVYIDDSWVLIAYCRLRKDARAFRVERFRSFDARAETFEPRNEMSFADVIAREEKNVGLLRRS